MTLIVFQTILVSSVILLSHPETRCSHAFFIAECKAYSSIERMSDLLKQKPASKGMMIAPEQSLSPLAAQTSAQDPEPVEPDALPIYGPAVPASTSSRQPTPEAIPGPLDRAVAIAVGTHPLVEAADAETRALAAEYRGARGLRYPSLSVEVIAGTPGRSIIDRDGLTANIALEQPIWDGGRIDGEIERARATLAAGNDRIDEAARQIVLQVTQAYYDIVLAEERIKVLSDSLGRHEALLETIERRVTYEVSPLADLTLGRSRTAQVRLDLAGALEQRESDRVRLEALTGGVRVGAQMPLAGGADVLPLQPLALEEALRCDPTLAALTDLISVAEAERKQARSDLFPQVLLQLSQNEVTGARAAFVLRAQTGNGLQRLNAIGSADARLERAIAQFGDAERTLREQLRRDYTTVRSARERIVSGSLAADTADEIIASYQRQFIAGRRSWLDVMNAVREASSARMSEREAHVAAAAGTARILALVCRWQPAPIGSTP